MIGQRILSLGRVKKQLPTLVTNVGADLCVCPGGVLPDRGRHTGLPLRSGRLIFYAPLMSALAISVVFFVATPLASAQSVRSALAASPVSASFYVRRGNERYAQRKYEQAIADYDAAGAIDPRNAAIFNLRGLTWLALRDYGFAIRDFNRAIKLAPDFAAAYANRGLARLHQGREEKAAQDFAQCFKLDESLRTYVEQRMRNGDQRLTAQR